jgi:hypothetical protein
MPKLTDSINHRDMNAVLEFYSCGLYDDGGKLASKALKQRKADKRKRSRNAKAKR